MKTLNGTILLDIFSFRNNLGTDVDWQALFDIIVVGANKPSFLKNAALDLFQVNCR
jgi:hypothetical protein